jgi:hypothetical protein
VLGRWWVTVATVLRANHNQQVNKELSTALETVLQDLHSHCAVRPHVREDDVAGEEEPVVMLYTPGGSGLNLWTSSGLNASEQIVELADRVQEWAVEALWEEGSPAVWPECPAHPDSHPLAATVDGDTAVWACPRTRTVVAPIGRLPPPREALEDH